MIKKQAVEQLLKAGVAPNAIIDAFRRYSPTVVHDVAYKMHGFIKLAEEKKTTKFFHLLAMHRHVKSDKPEPLPSDLLCLIRPPVKYNLNINLAVVNEITQEEKPAKATPIEHDKTLEQILAAQDKWTKSDLSIGRAGIAALRAAIKAT